MSLKKGVSPIFSGVIYVAIIMVVIGIVMNVIIPQINKSKDIASFNSGRQVMYKIDKALDELSKEGEGAARIVDINLKKGKIVFNSSSNTIKYILDSEYEIMSPRIQKRDRGDVWIFSNTGVSVNEYNDYIILENSVLRINISKIGSKESPATINISRIINSVYQKQTGDTISGSNIIINVENFSSMNVGEGYVYGDILGDSLTRGNVIVHLENKWSVYDLYFNLESGSDFFNVYVKNYRTKP